MYSVTTPKMVTIRSSVKTLIPKKYVAAIMIGIKETITVLIIFWLIKYFLKNSLIKRSPPLIIASTYYYNYHIFCYLIIDKKRRLIRPSFYRYSTSYLSFNLLTLSMYLSCCLLLVTWLTTSSLASSSVFCCAGVLSSR